jgi:hypothetical protein
MGRPRPIAETAVISGTLYFDRIEWVATVIAQHVDWPGKQELISDCLADSDDRWRQGILTEGQQLRLHAILAGCTRDDAAPAEAD